MSDKKQVLQAAINQLAANAPIQEVVTYLMVKTAAWNDGEYNFTQVNAAHGAGNRELFIFELAKLLTQNNEQPHKQEQL